MNPSKSYIFSLFFIRISFSFINQSLPLVSDNIFPFQTSSFDPSNSINVFSLKNGIYGFSWLESSNKMVTYIYDSDTGKELWPSPIIFNEAIYDFPMLDCEVFYPEKGIMGFWMERHPEDGNTSTLCVQSFYISSDIDLQRPKQIIVDKIEIKTYHNDVQRVFDAKHTISEYFYDLYIVSWIHYDSKKNQSKVKGTTVETKYWKIFNVEDLTEEYEEVYSLMLRDSVFFNNNNALLFFNAKINITCFEIKSITLQIINEQVYPCGSPYSFSFALDQPPMLIYASEISHGFFNDSLYAVFWTQDDGIILGGIFNVYSQILWSLPSVILVNYSENSVLFSNEGNKFIILFKNNDFMDYNGIINFLIFDIIDSRGNVTFASYSYRYNFQGNLKGIIKIYIHQNQYINENLFILTNQEQLFGLYMRDQYISNCTIYNQFSLNCINCNEGSVLSSNGYFCFNEIPNCIELDRISGTCDTCSISMHLTIPPLDCVSMIDDCLEYNYDYLLDIFLCTLCDLDFALSNTGKKCVHVLQSCEVYDDFGGCLQCFNGYPPLSQNDPHQCENFYSFQISSDKVENVQKMSIKSIGNGIFVCSWLETGDNSILKFSILKINYDIFIMNDFLPIIPKFVLLVSGNDNILFPMQVLSLSDQSFIGFWSYYEDFHYNLEVRSIPFTFDQSLVGPFKVSVIMPTDDFNFNTYMHHIKWSSNHQLVIVYGIYSDFFHNFSIYCTVSLPNNTIMSPITLLYFDYYNTSQPLISIETFDNNESLAISYLTQNASMENFIHLKIIQFNEDYSNPNVLHSNQIGPFDQNSIKKLALFKSNIMLRLFWQSNNIYYHQRFNMRGEKLKEQEEILSLERDINVSFSLCILADGRWILIWQFPLNGSIQEENLIEPNNIFFKMEGDLRIHNFTVDRGDSPTISCSIERNTMDNSSTFLISWSKSVKNNSNNFSMKVFVSKFIVYCLKYNENLRICDDCDTSESLQSPFCWKKIENCKEQSIQNGYCKICEFNLLLVNEKGVPLNDQDDEGSDCVAYVEGCQQYNLKNDKKGCLRCSSNSIYVENNRKCVFYNSSSELTLKISLPIIFSMIAILLIIVIITEGKKRIFLISLEECDDVPLIHFIKKDETLNRKKTWSKNLKFLVNLKEEKNLKVREFIKDLKRNNDITLYEILEEGDEFKNFFQLKKKDQLGKGGFAQVWKAIDKKEQKFALKIFINSQKISQTETDIDSFMNMFTEYQIIYNLRHPSIVHVFGLAYSLKRNTITLGIVEELMDVDLGTFLKKNQKILNLNQKLNITIQISNAFLFVHSRKFVHHDVKPGNILISKKSDDDFEIKISDFGTCLKIARISDQDDDGERILSGISVHYASPENILHCCFGEPLLNDPMSDVWSLAIVFYKIFCDGKNMIFPWSFWFHYETNTPYPNQIKVIILNEKEKTKNKYVNISESLESMRKIMELINECLQIDMNKRPSIIQILDVLTALERNLKPKYLMD